MADPTPEPSARPSVTAAVEPVVADARRLGLTVDRAEILGVGANIVAHLKPAPVVARIATLTAAVRGSPAAYLRRERDICAAMSAAGLPVIPPTDLIDPGPHTNHGRCYLFLHYQDLEPVDLRSVEHGVRVGRSFAELATAMAEQPIEPDPDSDGHPWPEIDRLLTLIGSSVDPEVLVRLRDAVRQLRATDPQDPWQLVHGDAHRTNVALHRGEVTWFDFEDSNLRPLAWDLATLRRTWPAAGDEACRLLGVDPDSFSMRWHFELRGRRYSSKPLWSREKARSGCARAMR